MMILEMKPLEEEKIDIDWFYRKNSNRLLELTSVLVQQPNPV